MHLSIVIEETAAGHHASSRSVGQCRLAPPGDVIEPAASHYMRDNVRLHLSGRLRPFDLSIAVARAIRAASNRSTAGFQIEADILAALVAVGESRLVTRALESLIGQAISKAVPGSSLSSRLTLDGGHAILTLGCLSFEGSSRGAEPACGPASPRSAATGMSPAMARIVIESHRGRVLQRTNRGRHHVTEVRLPASFL